jgi:hypothetical protein
MVFVEEIEARTFFNLVKWLPGESAFQRFMADRSNYNMAIYEQEPSF